MIKRYNKFVNDKINEENEYKEELEDISNEMEKVDIEEEEVEEGGDIFQKKLEELANLLDADIKDNKVVYGDKEIIFPSETEMYHVDKKKFKTAEEVAEYLKKIN